MEDEKEVMQFLAQVTLGELVRGDVYIPAHVRRYCAEHPNTMLGTLLPSHLEQFVAATSVELPLKEQVERFEKTVFRRILRRTGNNRRETARLLGVTRVTVWNRMRKWGWIK